VISSYLQQILILIKRLAICYLAYFICRILFYAGNIGYFQAVGITDLLRDCFFGLRTDSFSIVVSNSVFILLSLLPLNVFWQKGYQRLLRIFFLAGNAVFLALNCIDIGYFPFIRKRSSADLLNQLGGQSDVLSLLPQFIKDFWWILLAYLLLMALVMFLYRQVPVPAQRPYRLKQPAAWTLILLLFLLSAGLSVIAVRGGLQRVPITIVDAGAVTRSAEVPLVLNTPFTIIKSMEDKALEEYTFYDTETLRAAYTPVHHYQDSVFRPQNVVVIILESFAKEYTRLGRVSYTPFLDSLMDWSLVCSNAYANGSKSIEGIPAILSGLPSLMENPFINSLYSLNDQTSLASILNGEGYTTAFFHGGINGTMNFDSWASLAGYSAYYGKNEYNNNKDFDNFWGIWDEPFLQFSVRKMNEFKEPFHSAVFTLSSHHPYKIPRQYEHKFPKGDLENSESIGYADYALRRFFEAASKTSWYKNTLFVLTADHGSLSNHPFYINDAGHQSIPVLFFKPDHSLKGEHGPVFSQTDILPSVLSILGYNKPFFCFGESFSSPASRRGHDYFYASATHYLFGDSMLYCFKAPDLISAYCYRSDSALSRNILDQYPALDSAALHSFRAFLQTYNNTLIHNLGKLSSEPVP
jgi:phosphoglycerol transferase MdoB-like AlkP superfamily enzyme